MPIHDWTRVGHGAFHHFHHLWVGEISKALNSGILPPDFYAYAEQVAGDFGPDVLTLHESARRGRGVAVRRNGEDTIVALIQVICPSDKASRNGLRAFSMKASAALDRGIHLLLLDLLPPTLRNPQGVHAAMWEEMGDADYAAPPDKPLTLAAYTAGAMKCAYLEPAAVGDPLPDMPVFLDPDYYVSLPLEATYQAAWLGVPRGDRRVLEGPS